MLSRDETIVIRRVRNGFVVHPEQPYTGMNSTRETHSVFNTLDALNRFLNAHFTTPETVL